MNRGYGNVLLILPPLCWSTMIVVGRYVIGEVPPASLTFWTWLVAALALIPFSQAELVQNWQTVRRELGLLLLYAIFGVAAFQGLYYAGLERTSAINASLLSPTLPVLVACMAWVILRERLSGTQLMGVGLALCGAIWIAVGGELKQVAELRFSIGDLLILGAFLSMAFYTVLLRKMPSALGPMPFMATIAVLGTLVLFPFYVWEAVVGTHALVPWRHGIAILYIGIITYDLAYVFWNISVKRAGANTTAMFLYLIPAMGTVLAIIFLGETVAPYHGIGIALIFSGIYLSLHRRSPVSV